MSGVLRPGGLNIQPCTRAEGEVREGVKEKVMCSMRSLSSVSVCVLPPRLCPALYLGCVGHLPISCQRRRYGTGRSASREGG